MNKGPISLSCSLERTAVSCEATSATCLVRLSGGNPPNSRNTNNPAHGAPKSQQTAVSIGILLDIGIAAADLAACGLAECAACSVIGELLPRDLVSICTCTATKTKARRFNFT